MLNVQVPNDLLVYLQDISILTFTSHPVDGGVLVCVSFSNDWAFWSDKISSHFLRSIDDPFPSYLPV